MIFDLFDDAYLINLKSRSDRLAESLRELEFARIPVRVWEGCCDPSLTSRARCVKSHCDVLRDAMSRGLRNVLIFEDDVMFRRDFHKFIGGVVGELSSVEWDMLYFGGRSGKNFEPSLKFISRCFRLQLEAYAVNCSVFEYLVDVEGFTSVSIPHDKVWYSLQVDGIVNAWSTVPLLAAQRWSKSDIDCGRPWRGIKRTGIWQK